MVSMQSKIIRSEVLIFCFLAPVIIVIFGFLTFAVSDSYGNSVGKKNTNAFSSQLRRRINEWIGDHTVSLPNPRITNGKDASYHSYFVLWGGCGATLIHSDIALSAAHCSDNVSTAQVGPKKRSDDQNWTRVTEIKRHPQFNPSTYDYDFAVLKLSGWFGDKHDTARLNVSNDTPRSGEPLTILGFGGGSQTLKIGTVDSVSTSICAEQWSRAGYSINENAVLCAESDSGIDACGGDSGGPLLLEGSSVQVGVISTGSGCDGRLPSVYSRVSAGQDWIRQQICELSDLAPDFCGNRKPAPGTTRIRVDIKLDDYPQDIKWKISEDPSTTGGSSATVASGGYYPVPKGLESEFVDLPDNRRYVFTIEDVGGYSDGIGHDGGYKIVTVDSSGNDGQTLASGGCNFQSNESVIFTIGNAPGPVVGSESSSSATYPPNHLPALYVSPTGYPTQKYTNEPSETISSTESPTLAPVTVSPTNSPSVLSTILPTLTPTTTAPTTEPTSTPTTTPTVKPASSSPTTAPTTTTPTVSTTTISPTETPTTTSPTMFPTSEPITLSPTGAPTTEDPSPLPTRVITDYPTPVVAEINPQLIEVDVVYEEETMAEEAFLADFP